MDAAGAFAGSPASSPFGGARGVRESAQAARGVSGPRKFRCRTCQESPRRPIMGLHPLRVGHIVRGTMQALSRLTNRPRRGLRAAAAWLAIAAVLGSLPLPVPARASCASRAACADCHRAASPAATCAIARPPCCRCEISSESVPSATPAGLTLEPPASQWHGLAVLVASTGAHAPQRSQHWSTSGPPGAPRETPASTTILRL